MSIIDSLRSAFTKNSAPETPDQAVELTPTVLKEYKPMAAPVVAPQAPAAPVVKPAATPAAAAAVDKTSLKNIQTAHPKVREELGVIYNEVLGKLTGRAHCRFIYVLRTMEEQAAIYAQGRTAPGKIVTNAPAGLSIHNYGLATDIVLIIDGKTASWDTSTDFDADGVSDWMEVVSVFKAHGWTWGGDWQNFKDLPHFEKTFGHKPSDLLAMYKAKDVDSNGYVNI